jgi:hypothetical protein
MPDIIPTLDRVFVICSGTSFISLNQSNETCLILYLVCMKTLDWSVESRVVNLICRSGIAFNQSIAS